MDDVASSLDIEASQNVGSANPNTPSTRFILLGDALHPQGDKAYYLLWPGRFFGFAESAALHASSRGLPPLR